jgi:hypothetical protein
VRRCNSFSQGSEAKPVSLGPAEAVGRIVYDRKLRVGSVWFRETADKECVSVCSKTVAQWVVSLTEGPCVSSARMLVQARKKSARINDGF